MKLTNLQLKVLSDNIYNNLLERKEQANKIKIAKYKPSTEYKKVKKLLEDIRDLNITIKSIEKQISHITTNVNPILSKYNVSTWGIPTLNSEMLESKLDALKRRELNIKDTSIDINNIRSELVMATIDKKFDLEVIIEELAKKFKVDE